MKDMISKITKRQLIGLSFIICHLSFSVALVSCDKDVLDVNSDPFKNQTYLNALSSPISTFLTEEGGYEEYVAALHYAGMFDALNQSSSGVSFTAFVPTNEAMKAFYQRRGVSSLQELPQDYMRQFVLYHTVKDSILPDAFVLKKSVQNLSGDELKIEIDSMHAGEATLNGEGRIVEMGLSAYNGKVYVLSSAMTPLVETVYDRIANAGTSAIMAEALRATGWDKQLSTVVDTTVNQDRQRVITHYYFTVLNVSDQTFQKAGIASLDALRSKLKSNDSQGLSEDSLLREYVGYHILKNQYTTTELGAMNGSEVTRTWSSSAQNQVFTVTYDSLATDEAMKYTLNTNGQAARFVMASSNVLSKNGYVHELDGWLPVWEPEQTTVLWDLADDTAIKNMVDAENYQPAEPTQSEKRSRVATASCFEYEMGESGSKNTSYSDIDYVTCTNKFKANNNDRIVFNLGYMGSASMTTPTIVRGKYRVELDFVYTSSQSFMRTQSDGNGGMLKIMFDDNDDMKTFKAPYTTVSSIQQGVYSTTLFDEVDFAETSTHKFSFTILDPAASTNKGFSLQFDCIRFIPIE
jgi:uncharacterized surface protein with fasciclin (FAS1) repeats